MLNYQIILGTSHGTTSHTALSETIAAIFTAHGFEVHHNISGYAGGNIVRTYGRPEVQRIHAIQIEINAVLLMTTSRQEFITQISRGEIPARAEDNIARLRTCLREIMTALPAVLAEIHT
jgi:N-formylglutamate amidohydrolase